jgi:hypothetical protein
MQAQCTSVLCCCCPTSAISGRQICLWYWLMAEAAAGRVHRYSFWTHSFTHCAPEIERLFESVARSCMGPTAPPAGEEAQPGTVLAQ